MDRNPNTFGNQALKYAAVYAIFGVIWILSTDQLVLLYTDDPDQRATLQTLKGWVFVFLSAAIVYGLVFAGQRNLKETNDRLDTALQQTSILDRILRHNLRNSCNVIQANARMLSDDISEENRECLERIEKHNDTLIELGEKSRELRDVVLSSPPKKRQRELIAEIESQIDTLEESYPDAEVHTDFPEILQIETDPRIDRAMYELLENAVEHNDRPDPTVEITVRTTDGEAIVEISDDGPGLPDIEQRVLEKGFETQLTHSQGLGLWIARELVIQHGGEFTSRNNDTGGTTITCTLPLDQSTTK